MIFALTVEELCEKRKYHYKENSMIAKVRPAMGAIILVLALIVLYGTINQAPVVAFALSLFMVVVLFAEHLITKKKRQEREKLYHKPAAPSWQPPTTVMRFSDDDRLKSCKEKQIKEEVKYACKR